MAGAELNLQAELARALTPASRLRLSRVLTPAGADLWLVEDVISSARTRIAAAGLTIGDYVVHDAATLKTNLGPVDLTTATV
jgi:hypothetical protein